MKFRCGRCNCEMEHFQGEDPCDQGEQCPNCGYIAYSWEIPRLLEWQKREAERKKKPVSPMATTIIDKLTG